MKSIIKSGSPKNVENRLKVRHRRHVAVTVREYNLSVKNSVKVKSLKNPFHFLIIIKLTKDLDASRKKLTDRTKDIGWNNYFYNGIETTFKQRPDPSMDTWYAEWGKVSTMVPDLSQPSSFRPC